MHSLPKLPTPSSAPPLAFLLDAHRSRTPTLLLVTGPSGSGKTSWCKNVVDFARDHHWSVAGLMSPAVMVDGQKVGIDLHDLRSNQRRRLATRTKSIVDGHETMPTGGVMTGAWSFDPRTLGWGNDILANLTCPDLLIIDELGPLEFRQRQGLQAAMRLIDAWRCNLTCVAIRPLLIGAARMRWPWSHILVVGEGSPSGDKDD